MENREPLLHCWINHQRLVPYSRTQLLPVKVKNFILWVFARGKSGIPSNEYPRRRNAEELEALQNPIRARLSHSHQFLLFLDRYLFHNLGVAKSYLPLFEHFINSPVSLYDGCDEVGGTGKFSSKTNVRSMNDYWNHTDASLVAIDGTPLIRGVSELF